MENERIQSYKLINILFLIEDPNLCRLACSQIREHLKSECFHPFLIFFLVCL